MEIDEEDLRMALSMSAWEGIDPPMEIVGGAEMVRSMELRSIF